MVNQMKTIVSTMLVSLFVATSALGQSQTAAEMQQQIDVAALRVTSSSSSAFRTPLETYQKFYTALTTTRVRDLLRCFSDAGRQRLLGEGVGEPSEQQIAVIENEMSQEAYANHTVLVIRFIDHPQNPNLIFTMSSKQGQLLITEEIHLKMVDTDAGWKIDEESGTILSKVESP
jgi:predicted phosphoribosyltransferase